MSSEDSHFAPADEALRLEAVRRYDILDTPPDGAFDRVTAIAADLFDVPIAIISIVDEDRIWFKSHHGLDVEQIERSPGLCASAVMQSDPWILTDASLDPRALANPLVAGEFGLRFYVGVPLRTHDGFNLGTLCVIDRVARSITDRQIGQLNHLASLVMDQLELRLSARRAVQRLEVMSRERDHRVMNSLQMVSSLLALQQREARDSVASEQLAAAATRVSAVARVHQHIYLSEAVGSLDCTAYLRRLAGDLSVMLGTAVEVVVDGPVCPMRSERVVPLGLIVNELVTNAAKHRAARIVVALHGDTFDGYVVTVTDDGDGLGADFDPAAVGGLGMKVVSALLQQLGGEMSWGAGDAGGACFTILLPAEQGAARADAVD